MAPSRQPAEESPHKGASSQRQTTNDTAIRSVEDTEKSQYRFCQSSEEFYNIPFAERLPLPPGVPRPEWYLGCIYDSACSSDDELDEGAVTPESPVSFSLVRAERNNDKDDVVWQVTRRLTERSHHLGNVPVVTPARAAEDPDYETDDSLYREPTPIPSGAGAHTAPLAPESIRQAPASSQSAPGDLNEGRSSPKPSPIRSPTEGRLGQERRAMKAQRQGKKPPRASSNKDITGLSDLELSNGAKQTPTTNRRKRQRGAPSGSRSSLPRMQHLAADREVMAAMPTTEVAQTESAGKNHSKRGKKMVDLRQRPQPRQPYVSGLLGSSDEEIARVDAEIETERLREQLRRVKIPGSNQSSRLSCEEDLGPGLQMDSPIDHSSVKPADWSNLALLGRHKDHPSWEVFAAEHNAPAVVRNILTCNIFGMESHFRHLRHILSIQYEWGLDFFSRLCLIARFPTKPGRGFIEQLLKLSRRMPLSAVERLFPVFLKTRFVHHGLKSYEKGVKEGTRIVTIKDLESFIDQEAPLTGAS